MKYDSFTITICNWEGVNINKRGFLIVLCVITLFLVTSVSASDLNESSVSEIDTSVDSDMISLSENGQNDLSVSEESEIISTNYTPKQASEIQSCVDSASAGDTIVLDGYYMLNSTVSVSKQLNFVGINNATVDGNNSVSLFSVSNSNIVFRDIVFVNGKTTGSGGAIYGKCTAINCTFNSNTARDGGGAMYQGSAVNCSFNSNKASMTGGAMYGGSAVNCTFNSNTAYDFGGAMYSGTTVNCSFVGNSAYEGGAIYRSSPVNCIFINNSAESDGGAMYMGTATNCTFNNNTATQDGGAMSRGIAVSCVFINNSAKYGGAMNGDTGSNYGSALNCTFINNSAMYGGAIYGTTAKKGSSIINCTFLGHGSSVLVLYGTSIVLDCIFDTYPTVSYYYTSFLNIDDLIIQNGANNLIAYLYDVRGPMFSKIVTFTINGVEYNVTSDSEGLASLNIKNILTEEGIYNVTVSYAGDDINYPVVKNITVAIIGKYATSLEANNVTAYVGEGILIASLSDMNGQLDGKTITFTIEGVDYNITTDSDGLAKINIGEYLTSEGSYDINVSFRGDDFNLPVSAISHIVVNKYDSVLEVDDLSIIQGDDGFLTVKLSDSRGVLSNKVIAFNINNNEYYNITDSNGIAKLYVNLYELGKYDASVSFAGNDYISSSSKNVTVSVNSFRGNLTVSQKGKYYSDLNLTFKLLNLKTGNPISDAVVNLIFSNGVSVNITTDSEGTANYTLPFNPGSYNLTASVVNMDYSDINTIDLNNISISNFIGQISVSQGENCRDLNIKLYNPETGDVFKNLTVTLKFSSGNIVDVVTDDEGISQYYMDFDIGTYSLDACVTHKFSEFDNVTLDNIVINNKENSEVILNREIIEFDYLSSGFIFAALKGCTLNVSDISVVNQPGALISIDDSNLITVSNLTAGSYILTLKTTPDSLHNAITKSINIKVNKINSTLNLVDSSSFDYGGSANIDLEYDGCTISDENIEVINHPEAVINIDEGILSVSNLTVGVYTLSVTTSPDANHIAVIRNVSITVNKVESEINFDEDISFDWGTYGSINVNTVGCTFKKDNISVIGHDEAVIRVSSTMISITNLTAGEYNMSVVTTPDENHKSVTRCVSLTVNKLASSLSFTRDVSFNYGAYGVTSITYDDCDVLKENIYVVDHPEANIDFKDNFITVSNLDAGSYILGVDTTPYDNYKSVTKTVAISVSKVDSDVTFSNELNFDYLKSDSAFITLIGCNISSENISVVRHPEANITLEGNILTVSNLTAGVYNLSIITTPDENHNLVNVIKTVTVNRIDSSISFSASEITFDKGGSGSVNVSVSGGNITRENILVEDHLEAVINLTDNTITVSNLTSGNYILRVTTSPDSNHNAVIRSLNIVVELVPSTISFDNSVVFDYGESGTTHITVDGGYVLTKDIGVVNHPEAVITMDNNNVISVSNLSCGEYVLSVVTTPDENHRSIENTVSVIVNKVKSTINFENSIIFEYGKTGSTLVSVDGGSILSASIVDNPDADVRVGGNSISVSGLNAGEYTLTVASSPDSNHYSSTGNLSVIVNRCNSAVSFSGDVVFDYQSSGSTFVIAEGGIINIANISVVNCSSAKITFENNLIGVSNLNAGNYLLSVVTTPDSNHKSVNVTRNITVNKISSKVNVPSSMSFTYLKSGTTFVTVDGGSVAQSNIKVIGQNAGIKLSGNIITVSGLNPGTYKLSITSTPDNNHLADVAYVTVTVKKATAKITAKAKSVPLKKGSWTITVLNSNNKPVSNMPLILKVYTGKKYKTITNLKTNSKGQVTYKTNSLSKGKHKVVVSINHAGYSAKAKTSSIKVVKQTKLKYKVSYTKAKDSSTVMFRVYKKGKPANGIKLKLLVYNGKKVVKTIKLKSKTFKKKKGIIGYTTNELSAGKHKIVLKPVSIKYKGSKKGTFKLTKKQVKYEPISAKISA